MQTPSYPHLCKAFGPYETNCYIVQTPKGELIIDPGMGSAPWVLESAPNPLAILITHGHFDHIYDVARIHEALPDLPIYCPSGDAFMMESDCFDTGLMPCAPSVLVECKKGRAELYIQGVQGAQGVRVTYLHFPGHTPGCSIVIVGDKIYSGDFIFKRSIGRYDFPYSSVEDMRESLQRFQALDMPNFEIFPGHGDSTHLKYEQDNVALWLSRM